METGTGRKRLPRSGRARLNPATRAIAVVQILALLAAALWVRPGLAEAQDREIFGFAYAICSAHGKPQAEHPVDRLPGEPSHEDGNHFAYDCCIACDRTIQEPAVLPSDARIVFPDARPSLSPAFADGRIVTPDARKPCSARSPPDFS